MGVSSISNYNAVKFVPCPILVEDMISIGGKLSKHNMRIKVVDNMISKYEYSTIFISGSIMPEVFNYFQISILDQMCLK